MAGRILQDFSRILGIVNKPGGKTPVRKKWKKNQQTYPCLDGTDSRLYYLSILDSGNRNKFAFVTQW